MKKMCLLLAAVMIVASPFSSFAEGNSMAEAIPEFTIVMSDKSFDDGFTLDPSYDDDGDNEAMIPDENNDIDNSQDKDSVPDEENEKVVDPDDNKFDDVVQDEDKTPLDSENDDENVESDKPNKDDESDTTREEENKPDDEAEGNEEEQVPSIDDIVENDEVPGIELLSFTPLTRPAIDDVFVSAYSGTAEIVVSGEGLEGEIIGLKIVPVGNESEIVYARQIEIGSYSGCIVTADLTESESQLFKLTVEGRDMDRFERFFACGESDKLICTRSVTGVKIESTADIAVEQRVVVKIMGTDGEVKYLKQVQTDSTGKYSVTVQLPDTDNDYIVFVTEGETGRQYVKTVGMHISESAVYTVNQTISGTIGKQREAIIYAKNISDTSKYIYEVTYDSSVLSVKNMNLLGDEIDIISFTNGRIVFTSKYRNVSVWKSWSGTINALLFEFLSNSSNTKITLKVYNK